MRKDWLEKSCFQKHTSILLIQNLYYTVSILYRNIIINITSYTLIMAIISL